MLKTGNTKRRIDLHKLDDLMERLVFSKPSPFLASKKLSAASSFVKLSHMQDIDLSDLILETPEKSDRAILLDTLENPEDGYIGDPSVVWPVDIGFLTENDDKTVGTIEPTTGMVLGRYHLNSVRTIGIREAKALKPRRISTKMVEYSSVFLGNDGTYNSLRLVYSWIGGQWLDAQGFDKDRRFTDIRKDIASIGHRGVPLGLALALTRRYEWAVSIGIDDSPKLTFTSDPSGLRAMFAGRDKPADRDRRSPLRHWVSEHCRKRRSVSEDEAFVRKHLRGNTSFKWYGYDCILRPSPFDLEMNEKLKLWKAS